MPKSQSLGWSYTDSNGQTHEFKKNLPKNILLLFLIFICKSVGAQTFNYGPADDSVGSYTIPWVSTAAVSASSSLIMTSSTIRVGMMVVNECGSDDIRVGPATVTAAVGILVKAGHWITLDLPRYFRGPLYGIVTSGSGCKVSLVEAFP